MNRHLLVTDKFNQEKSTTGKKKTFTLPYKYQHVSYHESKLKLQD